MKKNVFAWCLAWGMCWAMAGEVGWNREGMVGRQCDLRRCAFSLTGEARARRNEDGSVDVTTQAFKRFYNRIVFDLSQSDCGIATHVSFEIELLKGQGMELDMLLCSDKGYNLWHGMGTPGPSDAPLRGYKQLYGFFPQEGGRLVRLQIGTARATDAQTFRLKRLLLEFRGETVLRQSQAALDILKRQALRGEEQNRVGALQRKLDRAYAKVRGKRFRYGDAQAFLKIAAEVKTAARMELRTFASRAAFEATGTGYGVGIADSMDQVFLTGFGTELAVGGYTLELAANEHENFQTVVIAGKEKLNHVSVEVGAFAGPGGHVLQARSSVVGYSKSAPMPRQYLCETTGDYPEIVLLNQRDADVEPHESVPFWIQVYAPKGTPSGTYTATVTVKAEGKPSYELPLSVRVFGFELPDGTSIPTCFAFNERDYKQIYKDKSEAELAAFEDKMAEFAADYGVIYDKIYSWGMPGSDRRAYFERLKTLDDRGLLRHFCLCHLYYPGKNFRVDRSITDPNHPEVDVVIRNNSAFLKKHVPMLKELGIFDKAYVYGYDEDYPNAVIARICGAIKQEYPNLPIVTTMRYGNPNLEYAKDINVWVPIAQIYACNPGLVRKFRQTGRRVYWYICNFPRPPQPTLLLEVPGAVPRLFMGLMTQKYQPDGFLYWSATYWRNQSEPVGRGPRTNWQARTCYQDSGDGALFYPGENMTILPGLRTENYRDGIEDHWYYKLLEKALKEGRGDGEARKLLTVPETLVRTTGDYSTDSKLIRAQRRKVAEALERVLSR